MVPKQSHTCIYAYIDCLNFLMISSSVVKNGNVFFLSVKSFFENCINPKDLN